MTPMNSCFVARWRHGLMACGLLLAGLTACGRTDVELTVDRGLEVTDPSGQQVEFWYQYRGEREVALLDLIDLFNSTNPDSIQVTGKRMGSHADLYSMMLQGIHGGPLPELVVAYQNQAQIYHRAGEVVDLTPYMNSSKWGFSEAELGDYFAAFLDQDNIDGVQTAFLPNRSMEMLYYNEDWLRELGYSEPPRNWQQFDEMCRRAAAKPFSGAVDASRNLGYLLGRDASRWAAMIFSRGGDVINTSCTAYTFNTAEARASLEMVRSLVESGAVAIETARDESHAAFGKGQVLFATHSSSHVPHFTRAVEDGAGFAWNVAPVPYEGDHPVQNVYGASLAVCKSTAEQQLAAWLFIKWFTQPEQQDHWVTESNYFPVRRSIAHRLASYYRTAYDLLDFGKPEPGVGGYEPVRGFMVAAMMEIIEGGDMGAVLTRLEGEADRTLQSFE